ncbi:hypothetical protein Daus18300_006633 [Diaporthe australafricana]|uniref:Uncharacterized protein n=1 Tax=Diaporthe australafricana TaxID=127596 RepID=A0ABR3WTP7_9PEZI
MGMYCGMPWYPSDLEMGSTRRTPKCVWLDGDNSNGLPQALSFQLDAFADSADKMAQYAKWPDTLCRSTPRFSTWQDLDWNSQIPIFKPKLDYYDDSATGGQGADMDFGKIVDSDDCKYDKKKERQLRLDPACHKKGVWSSQLPLPWYQDKSHKSHKRHDRRHPPQSRAGESDESGTSHGMNSDTAQRPRLPRGGKSLAARFAEQLVVSTKRSHSSTATELCDSETSFGPDFVSTEEGLFCSMSQKKTFPLCNRNGEADASTCFDLDANELVVPKTLDTAHTKRILDELPITNYTLVRRW